MGEMIPIRENCMHGKRGLWDCKECCAPVLRKDGDIGGTAGKGMTLTVDNIKGIIERITERKSIWKRL